VIVWLPACSLYQSEFQCNVPPGVPCRSLQQVYAEETARAPLPPAPDPTRSLPPDATEEWVPPVKTVWIAPYLDSAGRRHEASILRLVVFPGARAVTAEPEFLILPIPETTEAGELSAPPAAPPTPPPAPAPRAPERSRGTPGSQGARQPALPPGLPQGLFTPPSPASPGAGFGLPGS
jgi:hypothetical protein